MAIPTIHVGCQGFGFSRLKALIACEGLEPVACVDIDIEGTRRNIESLDSPIDQQLSERVYTTITEARERHHAEACLIFASTPVHASLVVESLGLGMHTLCVKPIAVDQAEFRTVMKARNARPDLVLVQGQNKRWNPAAVKMREWLQDKSGIGEMLGGECRFWDRLDLRYEGRPDVLTEGLFFHAAAAHQLDQLVVAKGLPKYVTARVHGTRDEDLGQIGVPGTAGGQALLEYENGGSFSYTGTRAGHAAADRFDDWSGHWSFHGEQGDIRRSAGRLRLFRKGEAVEDLQLTDIHDDLVEDDRAQFDAFAAAVASGAGREWLETTTLETWVLMEACNRSAREVTRVDVDSFRRELMGRRDLMG